MLLAACSSGGEQSSSGARSAPPAAASPAMSPSTDPSATGPSTTGPSTTDPSATDDEPGTVVCGALASAINDGTLMNPGIVDAIVAASGTADAPIADAARRLAASYATATAAVGTEDEPDAVAEVSATAADMSDICGESGLDTVG